MYVRVAHNALAVTFIITPLQAIKDHDQIQWHLPEGCARSACVCACACACALQAKTEGEIMENTTRICAKDVMSWKFVARTTLVLEALEGLLNLLCELVEQVGDVLLSVFGVVEL